MNDSKSHIRIRRFVDGDNQQLIELAKSIGVPARIKLGVDRSPEFCAFNQLLSDRWDILVAEENHNIVGFMDMSHIRMRLGKTTIPVTYVSLTGVRKEKRGTLVFFRLLEAAEQLARASGSIMAIALINIQNSRIDAILEKRFRGYCHGQKLMISCMLLGPRYRTDRNFSYACATERDIPEIKCLLRKSYSGYTMSPVLDEARLTDYPRFGPKDILLARNDRGKIVAGMGLWDQNSIKKIRVIGYSRLEHLLKKALNASRFLTGFSHLPDAGENLNLLHSFYSFAEEGYEKAFSGLMRFACTMYASRNYNFLLLALPESSPLAMSCRRLWRFTNVNVPILIPLTREGREIIKEKRIGRIYFEYALT